jgi:hypothetical protein
MANLSNLVIEQLKQSPDKKFTARQLAKTIIAENQAAFADKRANPRFASDKEFESQVVAEIGAQVKSIFAKDANVHTRDKPRPRLYYWTDTNQEPAQVVSKAATEQTLKESLSEQALYPMLIEFLQAERQLCSLRIDEKTSKNSKGAGGNHWLHPDIVAMEPLDQNWQESVRTCVRKGSGQAVRLWSFEVKKELTSGNLRKCFFQAVSNSSWANFGYLVATSLGDDVEPELQMLCALHGIGVILLDTSEVLEKSQILIPAKEKPDVDWQSANRIVEQNKDFARFIKHVGMYHQTGEVLEEVWNR